MKQLLALVFCIPAFCSLGQGVELCVQTGHSAAINQVIFSPNDELIVSAGADQKIVIWDFFTGKQFGVLLGHQGSVTDIEFSKDGKLLYSSSLDSTVKIWDVAEEKLVKTISLNFPVGGICQNDDHIVAVGASVATINVSSYETILIPIDAKTRFTSTAISEDGTMLAFGGHEETFVYLIDLKKGELIKKFFSSAEDIKFDGNKAVLIASTEGTILEYNIKTRKRRSAASDWMLNSLNSIDFNEGQLFVADNKGEILILNRERRWRSSGKFVTKKGKIKDITISHGGHYLAAAGENRNIVIWDLEHEKVFKTLKGSVQQINDIAFSKDGAEIIIAYNNGSIRKTNLISNRTVVNSIRPKSEILSNISSYTIRKISKLGDDTISFTAMYRMNSLVEEGVYDQIDEYRIDWELSENYITLTKLKDKSFLVQEYIKDLKNQVYHDQYYFIDQTLLQDQNDSIGIKVSVEQGVLSIVDLATSKNLHVIALNHSDLVTSVAINPVYNYVATASWDGMVRFWDIKTGDLLTVYGAFGNGQFVYLDQSGYYFASKDALDNIGFKLGQKVYSFEQFDLKYNRPDIVAESLPYFNEAYIEAYHGAYVKRLEKLGLSENDIGITSGLPRLEMKHEHVQEGRIDKLKLTVNCHEELGSLNRLHISINGVPEFSRFGKELSGKDFKGEFLINLNPGTNYIQLYVTNQKGISSYKESFLVSSNNKRTNSKLFIVGIGVSEYEQEQYNLKYARKDAEEVIKYFKYESEYFSQISTKLIVDEEVTLANVEGLKEFAAQTNENDVFLFFAAGHGVLDAHLDYYFASHDMDFLHPGIAGIPYELFEEIMDQSKSRKKVMFLDACHSGEIDKDEVIENVISNDENGDLIFRSGTRTVANKYDINSFDLSKSLFADMRLNNGATVVSSAGGAEFAIEGDEWNNGVFTYCLLKGLREKEADLNKDKVIMLSELQKYIQIEVVKLSQGLQTPTSRAENLNNDFRFM